MSSRILIVEDEVQLARLMELELDHEGYAVKVSHNGREALELLKEEEFDLVLLDIMLPEMDGIEVCGRLRKFSDIPVIMVTAKDAVPEKVEALDTGADDYITKPLPLKNCWPGSGLY